jgi:hypothetical protein
VVARPDRGGLYWRFDDQQGKDAESVAFDIRERARTQTE